MLPGDMPALASQSLSIVISLVPYIRETFRRHLSQKQAVMLVEFDKLKRVCAHPFSAANAPGCSAIRPRVHRPAGLPRAPE